MRHIADSIIYLSGFISTVFFVLCGISYSSNKTWFIWNLFGGLVFGLLTGFLIWQNDVWKDQKNIITEAQNEIEPKISCVIEYPIKVENEKPYRNTKNPSIFIKNSGPIPAISLSATIDIYAYNTKDNEIVELIKTGFKGFDHAMSAKELEPFSDIEYSTIGIDGKDIIAVYSVSVSYYRKSDMKSFKFNELFFTRNKAIYSNLEFKKDDKYQTVIDKIKSFVPPDTKGNEVKFTAAADHIWFMESTPSTVIRKNEDGSVTILGSPENQKDSIVEGLPYLIIKPSRFKESGFFVEAEIEGEHIKAKVKYEVKNVGSVTAVVTDDGFNPVVEIGPGQIKYYNNTLRIERGPNNTAPLHEFIELLNTGKESLKITLNLLYHSKNDDSRLFKVTANNEFGINSAK